MNTTLEEIHKAICTVNKEIICLRESVDRIKGDGRNGTISDLSDKIEAAADSIRGE